jgi:hypothetical protein
MAGAEFAKLRVELSPKALASGPADFSGSMGILELANLFLLVTLFAIFHRTETAAITSLSITTDQDKV